MLFSKALSNATPKIESLDKRKQRHDCFDSSDCYNSPMTIEINKQDKRIQLNKKRSHGTGDDGKTKKQLGFERRKIEKKRQQ